MIDWSERARYESDLGVSPPRLLVLLFGPLATAVGCALLLKTAFLGGWYFIIAVPAVVGLLLGGVLYLCVGFAHCRNPWLAGGIGLVCGLVAFLGYYYFAMVDTLPPG